MPHRCSDTQQGRKRYSSSCHCQHLGLEPKHSTEPCHSRLCPLTGSVCFQDVGLSDILKLESLYMFSDLFDVQCFHRSSLCGMNMCFHLRPRHRPGTPCTPRRSSFDFARWLPIIDTAPTTSSASTPESSPYCAPPPSACWTYFYVSRWLASTVIPASVSCSCRCLNPLNISTPSSRLHLR